jgi:gamma-glutamyl:cysteine ligase YbdK (ATP-grasp superfamily)
MEPKFTGPSFTIGIEEELMILDAESLALANAIEDVLSEYGEEEQHVKPELLEPVLEIATDPHSDTRAAGEQLRELRRAVAEAAGRRDLLIGSAGTHPFALWEDQRVSSRPRYRELVPAKALARRLYDRLMEHAQDLGSAGELEALEDILERGNGAHRQRVVYEANHDLREVVREIQQATVP